MSPMRHGRSPVNTMSLWRLLSMKAAAHSARSASEFTRMMSVKITAQTNNWDNQMGRHASADSTENKFRMRNPGFLGYTLLVLSTVIMSGTGVMLFVDTITVYRAREWPVVEAHLRNCQMVLHSSKTDYYWTLNADWDYGPNGENGYSDAWTPREAPVYQRDDPRVDSASEAAAVTARFCNQAAIGKLRVSPQGTTRPDNEVTGQNLASDLRAALIMLLMGFFMTAALIYSCVTTIRHNKAASAARTPSAARTLPTQPE
jgi:hypothetical protein